MDHGPAFGAAEGEVRQPFFEELRQQPGLGPQAPGLLVACQELRHLFSEDRQTGRFQGNNGNAGANLGVQYLQEAQQIAASLVEYAELVERAPAAQVHRLDADFVADRATSGWK